MIDDFGWSRDLEVPAEPARLAEVRRFVEQVSAEANLDHELAFNLKVAVSEACTNAVQHSQSHSHPLRVSATLDRNRLLFEIVDGGGFHLPTVSNSPTRDSRGLGIPLMVALMDEVEIKKVPGGGTVVTLIINLNVNVRKREEPSPLG